MRFALYLLVIVHFSTNVFGQPSNTPRQQNLASETGKSSESITYEVPKGLTTPEYLRFEQSSQSGPYCGPNSLFLLLQLKGILVNHRDLIKRVAITPQGCSLAELQEVAESLGLQCEVRKVTLKELDFLTPPFIIHMSTPAESSQQPTGARDHFIVATRREPGGYLVCVDSSSGSSVVCDEAYLSRNFSVYVLVSKEGSALSTGTLALGGVFILMTVFNSTFLILMTIFDRKRARRKV